MKRLDGKPTRLMVGRRFVEIVDASLAEHVREAETILDTLADQRADRAACRFVADDLAMSGSYPASRLAYMAVTAFDEHEWPPHGALSNAVRHFENRTTHRNTSIRLRAAARRLRDTREKVA